MHGLIEDLSARKSPQSPPGKRNAFQQMAADHRMTDSPAARPMTPSLLAVTRTTVHGGNVAVP